MPDQPLPAPGREPVTEALIAELREREAKGIATYGQSLMTFDGRDPGRDLIEELLDAIQYAKKLSLENQALRVVAKAARDYVDQMNALCGLSSWATPAEVNAANEAWVKVVAAVRALEGVVL